MWRVSGNRRVLGFQHERLDGSRGHLGPPLKLLSRHEAQAIAKGRGAEAHGREEKPGNVDLAAELEHALGERGALKLLGVVDGADLVGAADGVAGLFAVGARDDPPGGRGGRGCCCCCYGLGGAGLLSCTHARDGELDLERRHADHGRHALAGFRSRRHLRGRGSTAGIAASPLRRALACAEPRGRDEVAQRHALRELIVHHDVAHVGIELATPPLEVGRVELVCLEVAHGRQGHVALAVRVLELQQLMKVTEVVEAALGSPVVTVNVDGLQAQGSVLC